MKLWSLQLQAGVTLHYNLWLSLSSQTVIKLQLKQFKHVNINMVINCYPCQTTHPEFIKFLELYIVHVDKVS